MKKGMNGVLNGVLWPVKIYGHFGPIRKNTSSSRGKKLKKLNTSSSKGKKLKGKKHKTQVRRE